METATKNFLTLLFMCLITASQNGCARPKRVMIQEMYPKCEVIGNNHDGYTVVCPETRKLLEEMRELNGDNEPEIPSSLPD